MLRIIEHVRGPFKSISSLNMYPFELINRTSRVILCSAFRIDRCGGEADDVREMSWTTVANSKQTQTPENIGINYDSERVECGKKVFVNIYKGKPVPKHYLVDCALCYIRENDTRAGCVLVGFLREEIAIVEQRLAEKRYPPYGTYWYTKNENLSVLVPFEGVDTDDEGRYASSFHSYLKVRHAAFYRGKYFVAKKKNMCVCDFFSVFYRFYLEIMAEKLAAVTTTRTTRLNTIGPDVY